MKLVFGKGKVSREELEREAAQEIESLIGSSQGPPPIDWSVYSLSAEVADPATASAGLAASATALATPDEVAEPDLGAPARAARVSTPKPARRKAASTTRPKASARAATAPAKKPATAKKPAAKKPTP